MFSWDPIFVTSSDEQPSVPPTLIKTIICEDKPVFAKNKSEDQLLPCVNESVISENKSAISENKSISREESFTSQFEKRVIDCRDALPKKVEIFLGQMRPILRSDKKVEHGHIKSEINPYGNGIEPTYQPSVEDWLKQRAETAEKNSRLINEARQNPPNLDHLLAGELPIGSRYEAGDYEKIGIPIRSTVSGVSPLVLAAHQAFCQHRPLALRPDDILLPIIQSVGIHLLSLDQTEVREKYFKRTGKIDLIVNRPKFVLGDDKNAWDQVIEEFSHMIADELGSECRSGLRGDFSTTGHFQNVGYDVALMNATRSVFNYYTQTMCGIPHVELMGLPDDWIQMGEKILKISSILNRPEWTQALKESVVDPLVTAAKSAKDGRPSSADEAKHWTSFYKYESESGGCNIDGWISLLFPYRLIEAKYWEKSKNPTWKHLTVKEMNKSARSLGAFMPGYTSVPMKWIYYDQTFDMRLLAGQVAVCQRDDGYLQPIWGWGVYHC